MYTAKELAKEIEEAVKWLVNEDEGCVTLKLDDRLAVCIGWSDGYDLDDGTVIHARNGKSWAVNAGIKVWTSDDLRTDLDWINMPYYESGDVWDTKSGIAPNENYESLAEYFLKEYKAMAKLKITKTGLIIDEEDE